MMNLKNTNIADVTLFAIHAMGQASPKGSIPAQAQQIPQIKWNMSTREISQRVDQMIAAVNRSNPIARPKQAAFTRSLSMVREAVVKNDMVAYSKAVND